MSKAAEFGALEFVSARSLSDEPKDLVFVLLDFAVFGGAAEEQPGRGFVAASFGVKAEFDSVRLVDVMNFQFNVATFFDMNLVRCELVFFAADLDNFAAHGLLLCPR
jgi:hypothetical protein